MCTRCRTCSGVDMSDRLRGDYKTQRRTRRWYIAMFYWALDTAIVNAFLLHTLTVAESDDSHPARSTTHMYFRAQLVDGLLARAALEREKEAAAALASAAAVRGHGLGVTRPLKKRKEAARPPHLPTFVHVEPGVDPRGFCETCGARCTAKCEGCGGVFFCCLAVRNCFAEADHQ
jgi:hypothetical protein